MAGDAAAASITQMTDREALCNLAELLRDVAYRLERLAPLVTEAQAKVICDLLEPSTHELGAKLAEVQQGDWIAKS